MLVSSPVFDVLFKLAGWKLVGEVPRDLKKALVIVCPHATWKDFIVGLGARSLLRIPILFWGKKELFEGPFGGIFTWLGGYPVNRGTKSNLVDSIVDIYNSKESFYAVLAPEGTRKDVQELKTGFYYIGFDFVNKEIKIREPYYTTGDFQKDKITIARYFQTIPGVQKSWIKNYLAEAAE